MKWRFDPLDQGSSGDGSLFYWGKCKVEHGPVPCFFVRVGDIFSFEEGIARSLVKLFPRNLYHKQ